MAEDRPTDELLRRILIAVSTDENGSRVRQIISEARAEAEAEIKAVVKAATKAALLRQMVEELESTPGDSVPKDELCREITEDVGEAHRRPGETSSAVVGVGPAISRTAELLDKDETSFVKSGNTLKTAIYVYAITRSAAGTWADGVASIDPAFPLRFVREGDIEAAVSEVSLDEFEQSNLNQRATQPGWIESKVRAHDQVIRCVMEAGTAIPCRFCTVLRTEADVQRLLNVHHEQILHTLRELDDTQEWGLKIFASPVRHSDKSTDAEGRGRAYMQRRSREVSRQADLDPEARAQASACHEELALTAANFILMRERPRSGREKGRTQLLNIAYLVRLDDLERFQERVAAMQERSGDLNLEFELTGPWPPYNFARLDLSLEAAA